MPRDRHSPSSVTPKGGSRRGKSSGRLSDPTRRTGARHSRRVNSCAGRISFTDRMWPPAPTTPRRPPNGIAIVSRRGPARRGRSCRCRGRGSGRRSSRSPDWPNARHAQVRGRHPVDPGEERQRVRVPVEHGDQRRGPVGREDRVEDPAVGASSQPARGPARREQQAGAGHADDVGGDARARPAGRPRRAPRARRAPIAAIVTAGRRRRRRSG